MHLRLIEDPIVIKSSTLMALAQRAMLLKLNVDPNERKSFTLMELPIRAKLLTDMLDDVCTCARREMHSPPTRKPRLIEHALPVRMKLRTETLDEVVKKLSTLMAEPNRPNALTLQLLAVCTKLNTEMLLPILT
jgi:hypothetical protein